MDNIKQIEAKLADAERAVSTMRQELDRAIGELSRLDVTAGDIEKAVDSQIRLAAKRDILSKRLEVATAAAEELRADMLVEKERDLREKVKTTNEALETARNKARADFQKMIIRGALEAHQSTTVDAMILLHRDVAKLLSEKERLDARHREAIAAASHVKQTRAIAESEQAAKMQADVFAGNI